MNKLKDTHINVRVTKEIRAAFLKICEENDRTQSDQISHWIKLYEKGKNNV